MQPAFLAKLRTHEGGAAWKQFLAEYSGAIIYIVAQYEYDARGRSDCYLFICEKLSDNEFRRLLRYRPEGSASFRSWLQVVVSNLSIDWKRTTHGRTRAFKSIRGLPQLEQLVFKYRFQQRLGTEACLAALRSQYPGLTPLEFTAAISQINAHLTPRQQWLLCMRQARDVSLDDESSAEPVSAGPDPELFTAAEQQQTRLDQALGQLTAHQRLLIKLRYQQELSLKEIARLTRLGDPFRARRHIQKALAELKALMEG